MDESELLAELRTDFIEETSELLLDCESSLLDFEDETGEDSLKLFKRHIHSIKGSAQAVELQGLSQVIHDNETLINNYQESNKKDFIKEQLKLVDALKLYVEAMESNTETTQLIKLKMLLKSES